MEKYVPYRAYLIRIWPTRRSGLEGYRASAEDVTTGERKDFPDLDGLFVFLQAQGQADPNGDDGDAGVKDVMTAGAQ